MNPEEYLNILETLIPQMELQSPSNRWITAHSEPRSVHSMRAAFDLPASDSRILLDQTIRDQMIANMQPEMNQRIILPSEARESLGLDPDALAAVGHFENIMDLSKAYTVIAEHIKGGETTFEKSILAIRDRAGLGVIQNEDPRPSEFYDELT